MDMRMIVPDSRNKYYLTQPEGWNPCIPGNENNRPYPNSVLANCIGSVVGRFNELAGNNNCDLLGNRYPGYLLSLAKEQGLEVNDKILPGGIIVILRANGVEGHVISVEAIDEDAIFTFESGWNYGKGKFIDNRWIYRNNNFGMSSDYSFAGCIHHPGIDPYPIPPDEFDTYWTKSGDYVRFVQWALNKEGCYPEGSDNTIDGSAGPATQAAIREFQARHCLRIDGYAGPMTLEVIKSNYAIL